MAVSRRTVDALARRAGHRPISRHVRADIDDALTEVEALTNEVLTTRPPEQVDAYLTALEALANDVERILQRVPA